MYKSGKLKKLPVLFFAGFLALGGLSVSAQTKIPEGNESELYCVNIPIEKVYNAKKGYVVVYRRGVNKLGTAYIPYEWFRSEIQKGILGQLGDGPTQPSLSVFYKEGKFYNVKLYVSKRASHPTWGNLSSAVNLDDRFEGVEELKIQF
ncbi:MAG: hypothetical protein LBQ44_00135 [Treponema sp.]|nr:hypothetical protein [Treponema sp.]